MKRLDVRCAVLSNCWDAMAYHLAVNDEGATIFMSALYNDKFYNIFMHNIMLYNINNIKYNFNAIVHWYVYEFKSSRSLFVVACGCHANNICHLFNWKSIDFFFFWKQEILNSLNLLYNKCKQLKLININVIVCRFHAKLKAEFIFKILLQETVIEVNWSFENMTWKQEVY